MKIWKTSDRITVLKDDTRAYEIDGKGVFKIDPMFIDWNWVNKYQARVEFKDLPSFVQREIEAIL